MKRCRKYCCTAWGCMLTFWATISRTKASLFRDRNTVFKVAGFAVTLRFSDNRQVVPLGWP